MKYYLLAILFCGFLTSYSQNITDNAVGIRLGSNTGIGVELSYQKKISSENRAELDLALRSNFEAKEFKITGLYQWVWPLDQGFDWYTGFGGGLGNFNIDINPNDTNRTTNGTFVFISGDVGAQYNFDFPLQLSIDLRPQIGSNSYFQNNFSTDLAIGARFTF